MKTIKAVRLFSFLLLLVIYMHSDAQWTQSPIGVSTDIRGVQLLSSTTGYFAGQKFASTSNGGATWSMNNSTTMTSFSCYGLYFVSSATGVVSGHNFASGNKEIQYTTDGGTSWSLARSGSDTIFNIRFVNSTTGYAIEMPNKVLTTTTGGSSWAIAGTIASVYINSLSFTSATTGYAACTDGLYKTINGGATWSNIKPNAAGYGLVRFVNDTLGYAIGRDTLYKTINAGSSWTHVLLPSVFNANIYFSSVDTGYICTTNGNFLLRTTNGGLAWEKQYLGTGIRELTDISFSGGRGVVVGNSQYVATTSNAGGSGYPIARFTNTSTLCDSLLILNNQSYAGYTYSWYYNGVLFSNAYNATHVNPIGTYTTPDVVKLVVSNGVHTDSMLLNIYPHRVPVDPQVHRFTFLGRDTVCSTGGYVSVRMDTAQFNCTYQMTVNGVVVANNVNPTGTFTMTASITTDSARVVVRGIGHGSCSQVVTSDSIVKIIRVARMSPLQQIGPVDSIVCYRAPVQIRIRNSSPFYKYYLADIYQHRDTTWGSASSDIFLRDSTWVNAQDTTLYVSIGAYSPIGCGPVALTVVRVAIRHPDVAYMFSDSLIFLGDTVRLSNLSHADSYQWIFDNSANRIGDTSTNSFVVYHTTGDKRITLVGNTVLHCTNDTLTRSILVATHMPTDSIGTICIQTAMDTGHHINSYGITAFHVDRYGYRYVGSQDFCTVNTANYSSTGSAAYLVKTDKNGNTVWYKDVPYAIKNDNRYYASMISGISTDPSGNVYVSGSYGAGYSFSFDTMSTGIITSSGQNGITNYFLAKFDSSGRDQWMIYSSYVVPMFSNSAIGMGAADIKYVDDEHIYALVLNAPDGAQTHYTDTTRFENYELISIVQINSRGQHKGLYQAKTFVQQPFFTPDLDCVYNPSNYTIYRLEQMILGPKLYVHGDCSLSLVGIYQDSIYFPGLHGIRPYGFKSMFVANLTPGLGWTSAYNLFGGSYMRTAYDNGDWSPGIPTGNHVPRFDFDEQKNIYVTAMVDTLLLSDSAGYEYSRRNIPYSIYKIPTVIAKFDRNGHKLWATQSLAYNGYPFIAGLNLTPDHAGLILTGSYLDGVNLSSTHQPAALMRTGQAHGNYIARLDTAGDVQWINNVPYSKFSVFAFSDKSCSGNIYTLASDSLRKPYHMTYNLYGSCTSSDTCPAPAICATSIGISLAAGNSPTCPGGRWQFTASPTMGDPSAHYQWFAGSVPVGSDSLSFSTASLNDGQSISCVMTIGGQTYTSNLIVIHVFTTDTPIISRNQTDLLSTPASSYQWYKDSILISGANSQTLPVTQNGTYTVQTTDSNGCIATSAPYVVTILGINDSGKDMQVQIYPIPSHGKFYIELNEPDNAELRIYNTYGSLVYVQKLTAEKSSFDLSSYAKGIYTAIIKNDRDTKSVKLQLN